MKFVSREKNCNQKQIEYLSKNYDLHPIISSVLINRGLTDDLDDFLGDGSIHDPFLLHDMQKAVDCISRCIEDGEMIVVYGDYDVDGVCSSSILYLYLKSIGADVDVVIPDRNEDGYGLNNNSIEKIASMGTKLLITVDCGISNVNEVEFAKSLGMEVIVTDHHQCPERIPDCEAVVNPLLGDYPFRLLCGSGVVLKLILALGGESEFEKYLDLAAIATVADLVPLIGENRAIVKRGLKKINGSNTRNSVGALCMKAGIKGEVTAGNIAFGIGPRINAAGRMAKAMDAFDLMVSDDYDRNIEISEKLNQFNSRRKQEESEIFDIAVKKIEEGGLSNQRIIMVKGDNWNKGVIGIVASKLVEKYSRPVIVFSAQDSICVGSGRSIPGIHLFNLLNAFGEQFIKFGGHEMAAGMSVVEAKFASLSEKLNGYALKHFSDELFVPTVYYDAELPIEDVNHKLAEGIQMLSPMGMGNKTPVFKLSNVNISNARLIGNEQNHIKMSVIKNDISVDAVAFSMADRINEIKDNYTYDIIASVEINRWENRDYVQLQIKEFKPSISTMGTNMVFSNGDKYFNELIKASKLPVEKVSYKRIRQMWNWEIYLERRLKKDVVGTAIYTSIPTCSYELIKYLEQENLSDNVSYSIGIPYKNSCVVFAPDWDNDVLDYARLVVFDYAPTDFINRVLEKNKGIQIVICHNDFSDNCLEKFIMGIDFEREKAGLFYSMLKKICAEKTEIDAVVSKFCSLGKETSLNAYFALNVFNELGLISIMDGYVEMKKTDEKKDLQSSKFIQSMYNLKNKIFEEVNLIIPPREYKGKKK